jgi:hypothetical protein
VQTKSRRRIRLRFPSPAMTVACLALAVALSGASYAAVVLPRNSVGTAQLKANAVTSAKVKNNAIVGADVNEARLGPVPAALSAQSAASAANADRLDSLDSTEFLRAQAKAADAELLDNLDSTSFLRVGAAAGGDLAGSYPNPTVSSDAIGAAEILNGSLNASDTFAFSGTVSEDPPSVPANSCDIDEVVITGMQPGDVGWLFPSINLSLTNALVLFTNRQINDSVLNYTICNVTSAAVNAPPGNWGYLVVDL